MFSYFKKKPFEAAPATAQATAPQAVPEVVPLALPVIAPDIALAPAIPDAIHLIAPHADSITANPLKPLENSPPNTVVSISTSPALPYTDPSVPRKSWVEKLKSGLRKTASSIATVFTGTQIDDTLYEELEAALLMSDAGVAATQHLLKDL